jgi:hypothetical protein
MMNGIRTEIEINAPIATVWKTLTGFASYADWNPFILRATADFAVGSTIEFVEDIPDRGQFKIRAIFTQIEPNRVFQWRGHYMAPFILEVNHYFILEPLNEACTRFLHGQNQTGILVPFLSWQHHFERLQEAYILMNEALKVRCERKI